jgi:hypothetical protein
MAKPAISRIRDCIRSQNYAVSIHASEELDDDNLTIYDLESIVLTGEIVERQRDRKTREAKFVIRGFSLASLEAETVVKFGPNGGLFIITVYLA